MKKLRKTAFTAGILLLVLSMAVFYISVRDFQKIRPASDYSDKGVHTFEPYQTYPTRIKNTATGRQGDVYKRQILAGKISHKKDWTAMLPLFVLCKKNQ